VASGGHNRALSPACLHGPAALVAGQAALVQGCRPQAVGRPQPCTGDVTAMAQRFLGRWSVWDSMFRRSHSGIRSGGSVGTFSCLMR